MAIQQVPFKRNSIDYMLNIGVDATGDSVDYIDRLVPDANGNNIRYYPVQTIIYRDKIKKRGGVKAIHSIYACGVIGGNGEIIEGSDKEIPFVTGILDIKFFVAGLGMPIMMSGNNGFVRNPLGFNDMPIFYSENVKDAEDNIIHYAGQVIDYTEEEEAATPTKDYWIKTNPPVEEPPAENPEEPA